MNGVMHFLCAASAAHFFSKEDKQMKIKQKRIIVTLLVYILTLFLPLSVLSHSGRTDSSGGHKDNKNKSGLGSYHYHCGGYPPHLHNGGVCPYRGGSTNSSQSTSANSGNSSSKPVQTPKPTPTPVIYASEVRVTGIPESIDVGKTTKLEASVYPENAEDKEITWSSDNPDIVSVDANGNLTAKGVGVANITAQTSKGTASKFTVTPNEVIAEDIIITNASSNILIGDTALLSIKYIPENTTNKNIIWSSDNNSVISITNTGKITANSLGTAKITATHNNITKSVDIVVLPIEADTIELTYPAEENKLKKGENVELKAAILPANTTDKTIKWSVDNDEIAEIDKHGILTAKKTGTVIVTAETANGKKQQIEIKLYSYDGIIAFLIIIIILSGTMGGLYLIKKKKNS